MQSKKKRPSPPAGGGDEVAGHITALSDDVLRLLLKLCPPKETSSLLQSCKTLNKLAADAWEFKLNAMRDEYVIPYEESNISQSDTNSDANSVPTPARHYRDELQKRYRRLNRYRPNIECWGEEPYWYMNHPCQTSAFNAVRRAHDVTDFRLSVKTNRLEKGRYRAYWRVNSTSGFCVLQLDTEVRSAKVRNRLSTSRRTVQEGASAAIAAAQASAASAIDTLANYETDATRSAALSSARDALRTLRRTSTRPGSQSSQSRAWNSSWNAREDRGKGWTEVCATGGKVIEIGSDGGYIKARMWKRELDFTGGILVDCLRVVREVGNNNPLNNP